MLRIPIDLFNAYVLMGWSHAVQTFQMVDLVPMDNLGGPPSPLEGTLASLPWIKVLY